MCVNDTKVNVCSGIDDDSIADRSSDKLQSAICYAIDGDQVITSN